MKSILLFLFTVMFMLHANAQLSGTKWKTTLQLDQPTDVVFNFYTDTLAVISNDGNMNLETMKFSSQDTVLTLQKLFGQSDCDTTAKGNYSFKVNDKQLFIKLISDDCPHRSDVIKDIKLDKVE